MFRHATRALSAPEVALFGILAALPLAGQESRDLFVTVGKSVIVDSPVRVERVLVGDPAYAEAVAVNPREVVVNGKAPGETSLIVWQQGGNRLIFELHVRPNNARLQAVQRELDRELGKGNVSIEVSDKNVFVRGTVEDLVAAERAVAIAGTLAKPVNLLSVNVPEMQAQILLKVRFANVDRASSSELGFNFFSLGTSNTMGRSTTGQFTPPSPQSITTTGGGGGSTDWRITDALNLFIFRTDIDLGATIKALENKRLLQLLAEPNLLTTNGRRASFLAGGEFPYPTLQGGGAGLGAVTIQFREFGVRITFVPTVTPRGTIRLEVSPRSKLARLCQCACVSGFHNPRPEYPPCIHRGGTAGWPKFRHRRPARQSRDRIAEQGAWSGRHTLLRQAVPLQTHQQEQHRVARVGHPPKSSAPYRRTRNCRRSTCRSPGWTQRSRRPGRPASDRPARRNPKKA